MQTRFLATGVLLVAALAVPSSAQRSATPVHLVHPGVFHRVDLDTLPARGWLALVRDDTHAELLPVTVAVAIVPDDIDPVDGPYTARKVWAMGLDGDRRPVFMARGLAGLRASARVREATIDGAPWDEQLGADLAYARRLRVALGASEYHLQVLPASRATRLGEGATVRLQHGMDEQEIYRSAARPDEPAWLALWAGDLDADGRLDLYMDLAPSFNLSRRVLFLSSGAAPGAMVREAAVFETRGALDDVPTWTLLDERARRPMAGR
jgi:hypothetical protein